MKINYCLFTTLVLLAGAMNAYAITYNGTCGEEGDNLRWEYSTNTVTLTIAGTGRMEEAAYANWEDYAADIQRIVIKDGVTNISEAAFYYYPFSNLYEVKLGNTLTDIGVDAFRDCSKLEIINFPSSLKNIQDGAFLDCSSLKIIDLPNSMDTIGQHAFSSTAVQIMNLPNQLKYLGAAAFESCKHLKLVTLPKTLTSIEVQTFNGCSLLNNIIVPNNITSIDQMAFNGCTSLTNLTLHDYLQYIGWAAFDETPLQLVESNWFNNVFYLGPYCLFGGKGLSGDVVLKDGTTLIATKAFFGLPITSITMSKQLKYINERAFYNCNKLTSVDLGKSLLRIGIDAFGFCQFTSLTLPNTVTEIGEDAFYVCDKLESISLSSSLQTIGEMAFESCYNLKSIVIPDNVTRIEESAFIHCYALTDFTVGKAMQYLASSCVFPENVKHITWNAIHCKIEDDWCISSQSELETIVFGEEVEYIPDYICYGAEKLQSFIIPNSVKEIGYAAFNSCTALTNITLPAAIEKIGDHAFSQCDNLDSVTCLSVSPAELGYYSFEQIGENATLYVPCGSINAYKNSDWNYAFEKIEEFFPYKVEVSSSDEQKGRAKLIDKDCQNSTAHISATSKEGFSFVGWNDGNTDPERVIQLTQDTNIVALFEIRTFNILFVDYDGSLLKEDKVTYNTLPIAPDNPQRTATVQYTYTFTRWQPEITEALADAVYTAQYDSTLNQYTVTFLNEDGSVIESKKWRYGEMPMCAEPVKEPTSEFVYHFDGWQPELETVTGNTNYTAYFRAVPIHTLVFLDWNGDELGVVKVEDGMEAMAPVQPVRDGFVFNGWSRDLTAVTNDMYVIALYSIIQQNTLAVHFVDNENQLILTSYIMDAIPQAPVVEEKVFVAWQAVEGSIENGVIVRPLYINSNPTFAVSPLESKNNPKKILRDGNVYILRDDKTYTIMGTKVK